jgi:hypothetical protein
VCMVLRRAVHLTGHKWERLLFLEVTNLTSESIGVTFHFLLLVHHRGHFGVASQMQCLLFSLEYITYPIQALFVIVASLSIDLPVLY